MAGFISVIRSTLAEIAGRDVSPPPRMPDGMSDAVRQAASDGAAILLNYQGRRYTQLYFDRLKRFVGRRDVSDAMLCEIARLMAERMSYQDAIRIAQLKLAEPSRGPGRPPVVDIRRFRIDELVSALPEIVGDPVLWTMECLGLSHRTVAMKFSTLGRFGVRRLKIEASLRRWRLLSIRYETERVWVERWLHMIDRSLARQPEATAAIVQSATMIQGYGTSYRQGMAAWHQIINGLAKPTFDGTLRLPDLTAAIARARAAPHDPKGDELRKVIAQIRAQSVEAAA